MAGPARQQWAAVHALAEPTRRRVYEAVRAARVPLTRDAVADAVEIGRPLAAFHLDALAAAGLLDVDFARPPGRQGPGAGRPAKRYQVAADDIAVSVPERHYDLAAEILVAAVRDAGDRPAWECALQAASAKGREVAQALPAATGTQRARAVAVLDELGYEPTAADDAETVRLRNCPFHALVEGSPELICGINLHFLQSLMVGLELDELTTQFAPTENECCVHLLTTPTSGGDQR